MFCTIFNFQTRSSDWEKIKATYNREERKDTKHKGHPMPHPEKYLENMYKVGVKKV